jgi:integrase
VTAYKNARGKWSIDIDDFYHANGSKEPRIRKTSPVNTKPGAERYERQVRQALQDGVYRKVPEGDVPTLAAFAPSFIAFQRSERKSATGIYNNESLLKKHLVPLFGGRLVTSFGKKDELALKAHFENRSESRYNQAAAAINGTIGLYYATEELKDPFKFKRLKIVDVTKGFYEFPQYAQLLSAAKGIGVLSELVVLLGRDAALRRSEMFGLMPSNCRMNERKLVIERAEKLIGKRRVMGYTKGKEMRTLDMTPAIHDCLTRYFKKFGQRERMVVDHDGSLFAQQTFARFMGAIQKAAGLKVTGGVHILRHTACSHMAILGVPVTVIQKYAGHQQLATTLGYMHLAPGDQRLATDALSRPVVARGNATTTVDAYAYETA